MPEFSGVRSASAEGVKRDFSPFRPRGPSWCCDTTVSRRGSLHEHYNDWRGLGEERVLGMRDGWRRVRVAATGPQSRPLRCVVGSSTAARDHRCRSRPAGAAVATIGSAHGFKNGRQLAAWLGLVPTQHSSGGHVRLGSISCRGDAYLLTLLSPSCAQQPAARQGRRHRKSHARATLDTRTRWTPALRQGAGRHRQQTCQADLVDAGTRCALRPSRAPQPSAAPARSRHLITEISMHRQRSAVATGQTHPERTLLTSWTSKKVHRLILEH